MAENQNNTRNEIDLLELLSSFWKAIVSFFKFLLNSFLFLFVFGLRRIHWMLLFLLAGMGLGYLIFKQSPPEYSSEMIAQPNGFTSTEMAQYINDIHLMCERNNFIGLSEALNITAKNATLIQDIEAFHFIDVNGDWIGDHVDYKRNFNPRDSTTKIVQDRILIKAEVLENNMFRDVRNGLINYINNNEYLMTVNRLRRDELEDQIALSEEEIEKLDSLQNFEYYQDLTAAGFGRQGQILFLNENPTQLYYQDKELLLRRRLTYQKALELATEPLTIIKDFSALQVEENPVAVYLIKYGLLLGVIGYFYLLYYANRKGIIRYLSTKA